MDVNKKWSDFDKSCASNLIRAFKKMKCEDFYGYEIRTLATAMQWLEDLHTVMQIEPVKAEDIFGKEKNEPAKVKENETGKVISNGTQTTTDKKAARNSKAGSRQKPRSQTITNRKMGISV